MNLPSSRAYGGWLAAVRIFTGAIWLIHAIPKFRNGDQFLPPAGFVATYAQQGIAATSGPYHDFLTGIVQPNLATFAELVRFGELGVGVTLFFGLFSRVGAFFGIVLTLNYIAARGGLGAVKDWGSLDACLMLLSAISLVLPTGRVLGVDALSARRSPRRTVVVPEIVPERPLDGPSAPR